MKRLLYIMCLLIILQITYYHFIMQPHNTHNNPISIISVLVLLGIYLKRTVYTLKFGPGHNIQKIGIALIIIVMLYSFFLFFSIMGSLGTGMLYVARYSLTKPLHTDPTPLLIWKNHFITYQFLLFILNAFVVIIKSKNDKFERKMKILYPILSVILLLTLLLFIYYNLHLFYFSIFVLIQIVIYWAIVPVLYNVCSQFHQFIGVLLGLTIVYFTIWPVLNLFLYDIYHLHGFLFS